MKTPAFTSVVAAVLAILVVPPHTAMLVHAQQPRPPFIPEPLPPLAAPPPPASPPPATITRAAALEVLRRAKRLYLTPTGDPTLRRELMRELKAWDRFKIVRTRRAADIEMTVAEVPMTGGMVGGDPTATFSIPTSTTTEVAIWIQDTQHTLWIGTGARLSSVIDQFKGTVSDGQTPSRTPRR